ncbi:efflux RND transporter periplasmic adaptor subunit [Solirhodobacter olei]|uniref:efflux RND transporter periplasmic adaptor subunit n=1 Tax=Solirhodobacter olei TaxID=2493082 RepID=UPI000FD7D644|nr:HlyD family efflux transporter periplasmic adaptor subunit [Solirhodobacter olei]
MSLRRLLSALAAILALTAALTWAFWPDPVPVDLATVTRGPMEVTVSADGVTHIRDVYEVTAPMAGTVRRAPVSVGDDVRAGQTVVASIQPLEPGFLDARARAQAEAAVDEAQASLQLSKAKLAEARTTQSHAESEYIRAQALAARGTIPQQMLEDADAARQTAQAAVDAAQSSVDLQQATLTRMQAQLVGPGSRDPVTSACCLEIKAPATGTVLFLANSSARPVQAGETLMTIGSLDDLEVVVDLLSSDAVKVPVGAAAHVERWGGPQPIEARVRQIEPAAFTKVSALGIEEQRVRLRLDILTPPEKRRGLGDNYRVFVRVVTWSGKDVLQVPIGALFRSGDGWAVFRDVGGRAIQTPVTLGHQTDLMAEVVSGLSEGDRVVVFPSTRITEHSRISPQLGGTAD